MVWIGIILLRVKISDNKIYTYFLPFYRLYTWISFMFICRNWIYWDLVYCSVPVVFCRLVGTNTTFTTLNPQQTACTLRPHSVVPAFTAFPSQCKSCYSHVNPLSTKLIYSLHPVCWRDLLLWKNVFPNLCQINLNRAC